jgi:hypothetical protein
MIIVLEKLSWKFAFLVITGLVPVISIQKALRFSNRDGRDKPSHDARDISMEEREAPASSYRLSFEQGFA